MSLSASCGDDTLSSSPEDTCMSLPHLALSSSETSDSTLLTISSN